MHVMTEPVVRFQRRNAHGRERTGCPGGANVRVVLADEVEFEAAGGLALARARALHAALLRVRRTAEGLIEHAVAAARALLRHRQAHAALVGEGAVARRAGAAIGAHTLALAAARDALVLVQPQLGVAGLVRGAPRLAHAAARAALAPGARNRAADARGAAVRAPWLAVTTAGPARLVEDALGVGHWLVARLGLAILVEEHQQRARAELEAVRARQLAVAAAGHALGAVDRGRREAAARTRVALHAAWRLPSQAALVARALGHTARAIAALRDGGVVVQLDERAEEAGAARSVLRVGAALAAVAAHNLVLAAARDAKVAQQREARRALAARRARHRQWCAATRNAPAQARRP